MEIIITFLFLIASCFWIVKKVKKKVYSAIPPKQSSFHKLSPTENGILPSCLDALYETIKPRDIMYFFGFDKGNSFQLTLKAKSEGCFFVASVKIDGFVFENCGYLENDEDGFRGRYINVSKLEDCRRWRIVILCKLTNHTSSQRKFARINLLWQALQEPKGDVDLNWIQWGVLQGEVLSPGVENTFLYLRGIRGKQKGVFGCESYSLFLGDHGKMMFWSNDEKRKFASVFLPGEPPVTIRHYNIADNRTSLTDSSGDCHTFSQKDSQNHGDNQSGQISSLHIPELDMVDWQECVKEDNDEEDLEMKIISFKDPKCDNPIYTGGKGSSLGRLTKLDNVSVPAGFCITTTFFKDYLDETLELHLRNLEKAALRRNFDKSNLEISCNQVQEKILSCKISGEEIESAGWKVFGRNVWEMRLAVRSSGVGEDGQDQSCAGQNDTYLGISGRERVLESVVKCWASAFSFRSVEYRRQNGQPIITEMCIVIQEMVTSALAGVIFTADPVTGEDGRVTITANWGLGETVVSGQVEPDTIIVDADQMLVIKRTIGSKLIRHMTNDDNIIEIVESSEKDNSCCVDDNLAFKLTSLALELDKKFDCALDIEFAVTEKGDIKMLQARPITTFFSLTDWELTHEFDTAVPSDKEIYTRGNVGEVFNGALTPLTMSSVVKALDLAIAQMSVPKTTPASYITHTTTWLATTSHQVFLKFLDVFLKYPERELNISNKGIDFAVFGHTVTTKEMLELSKKRHKMRPSLKHNLILVNDLLFGEKTHKKICQTFAKIELFPELQTKKNKSSQSLYLDISNKLHHLLKIAYGHSYNSERSSIVQMITFLILAGDQNEWSGQLLSDVAVLLTTDSQDVESAGVPSGLQKLMERIKNETDFQEKFEVVSSDQAEKWLRDTLPQDLEIFLENFGHRCLKEFELMSKTWGTKLSPLVQTLQAMVSVSGQNKLQNGERERKRILDGLPFGKRVALKMLLPLAHSCVANREKTKSFVIRTVDQFRKAFQNLGEKMTDEGYLSESGQIWFLTHHEIGQILKGTKRSQLQKKAMRRKLLHSAWDQKHFSEIVTGNPVQIETSLQEKHKNYQKEQPVDVKARGTPACPGLVTGPARIVTHISEADQIQPGDILITHSTDIGWSPYFPILSGVITELGGLISHGAVVAREYGLPCLVGVANATQIFHTGDLVTLDAINGELSRNKS